MRVFDDIGSIGHELIPIGIFLRTCYDTVQYACFRLDSIGLQGLSTGIWLRVLDMCEADTREMQTTFGTLKTKYT